MHKNMTRREMLAVSGLSLAAPAPRAPAAPVSIGKSDGYGDGLAAVLGRQLFQYAKPQVLIVGSNPVCTDAVAAAVMGYNPRARRGETPFHRMTAATPGEPEWADNPMLLAEAVGIGSSDLDRIDVRGVPIKVARPSGRGKKWGMSTPSPVFGGMK